MRYLKRYTTSALGALFSLFCLCTCISLKAQTLIMPAHIDAQLTSWVPGPVPGGINCDMLETPYYGTWPNNRVWAIAWDKNTSAGPIVHLSVVVPGWGGLPIEKIDDAHWPDVVIGDDMTKPGKAYIITVIYNEASSGEIMIKTFNLDPSVFPYVLIASTPKQISNGNGYCMYPHIDLFSNTGSLIGPAGQQLPSMNKYVATWSQSSSLDVEAAIGDVNTVAPAAVFTVSTSAGCPAPDVAAYSDASGADIACFAYGDGTFGEVSEFDVSLPSSPTLVGSPVSLPAGPSFRYKIEAMNQYNGMNAKWVAVVQDGNTPRKF